MNRPAPKMLTVIDKAQISLNMIRVTLHGRELDERIHWHPGGYVKLVIPNSNVPGKKPKVRTYTARSFDPQKQTMTIDFAIHQPAGPATSWAINAQEGDEIAMMGLGKLKLDPSKGDWYLFAADMSAIPAALSVMESLGPDAKGYAILEIMDERDKQTLAIPEGFEVQWLIHPTPETKSEQQLAAIKNIHVMAGIANIFVAGELSTIREIKRYITTEESFKDAFRYISSYWKIGLKEEEHKEAKRRELR